MKRLSYPVGIVLHCTATSFNTKPSDIRSYHVKQRGWFDCGYHYLIDASGQIFPMRPCYYYGAHTAGHNDMLGVAYIGGIDKQGKAKNTLTSMQLESLCNLLTILLNNYHLTYDTIHLHNEFANKSCPSFGREFLEKYILPRLKKTD